VRHTRRRPRLLLWTGWPWRDRPDPNSPGTRPERAVLGASQYDQTILDASQIGCVFWPT
jgi:hypothetical protein